MRTPSSLFLSLPGVKGAGGGAGEEEDQARKEEEGWAAFGEEEGQEEKPPHEAVAQIRAHGSSMGHFSPKGKV
ncbi:hypothetical protein YIM1640_18130 [Thermus oshimai]